MTLPDDLKSYRAPDAFDAGEDVLCFLALVGLAIVLLLWWGVW